MQYSGAGGKLIHKKSQKQNSRDTVPLTSHWIFSKHCPFKVPGHYESEYFFLRILHSFCVLGENAESV